jgi:hypothetical protein
MRARTLAGRAVLARMRYRAPRTRTQEVVEWPFGSTRPRTGVHGRLTPAGHDARARAKGHTRPTLRIFDPDEEERAAPVREPDAVPAPEPVLDAARPARPVPMRAAQVLALQRTAGNRSVVSGLRRPVIARKLDDSFEPAGKPTEAELAACKTFAQQVSDIVDQAYGELMRGDVAGWEGQKIATFLRLLRAGEAWAVTHAGNAIEERVYALMGKTTFALPWTPQFAEAMGGASKPDIVVKVGPGREALIDVTSDRGHIIGKAGGWLTSERYVYVAEAYFDSIRKPHMIPILEAVNQGGVTDESVQAMKEAAERQRQAVAKLKKQIADEARALFAESGNMSRFAKDHFDGSVAAASRYLRERGVVVKGSRPPERRRTVSDDSVKKRKQAARKRKSDLTKVVKREAVAAMILKDALAAQAEREETAKVEAADESMLEDVYGPEDELTPEDEIELDEA